ncbi:MAG: hypothetical protein IK088_06115 [Lachnospiraceae bacterium]|nr:hypothetical protein [Lachnospiraceae bacterium]
MNVSAVIRASVKKTAHAVLHIGGTAFFRVFADGAYVANGPARTVEGYIREDEIELPAGITEVRIEAAGYYCRSLSTVLQPSFVIAEITEGNEVLWATGKDTPIFLFDRKLRKTERYSVQRHFTEVYDYCVRPETPVKTAVIEPEFTVLPRRAPYPAYEKKEVTGAKIVGTLAFEESLEAKKYRYSWKEVPEEWGIFSWDEIPHHPHYWIQKERQTIRERNVPLPIELRENEYAIFDYQSIEAGFISLKADCRAKSELIVAFAEHTDGETFTYPNMNVHNAVEWILPEGTAELQSFEPYTARIVMVAVKSGCVLIERFGICTYESDDREYIKPRIKDRELREIYESAVRNYRHNSVDLFTDCPSRERAGWLGDAYFTAKAEYFLTGRTRTEDAHLENLRLYKNHGELPQGALPETCPTDIPGVGGHGGAIKDKKYGTFIPQSNLMMLLETAEYLELRGHIKEKDVFLPMVTEVLAFFARYENEEDLLERLPSWNFVEWSKANEWTNDVNYPTNFLYSEVLFRLARIYDRPDWLEKAKRIRSISFRASFDGRCFRDHAVRNEAGELVVQPEKSEACQYYALLYGDFDVNDGRFRELRRMIREDFAFGRPYDGDILPAEMILGLYLRIELLMKWGERELLRRDVTAIFGKMHEGTHTLWEYLSGKGSRDHGMCSYIVTVIAFIENITGRK